MKRRRPKPAPVPPAMETTIALIEDVMGQYVDNVLLCKRDQSMGTKAVASVSWSFSWTSVNLLQLSLCVRSGAFGEIEHVTTREWHSIGSITRDQITNALFASLTFAWSPYWFDVTGKQWHKHEEIAG